MRTRKMIRLLVSFILVMNTSWALAQTASKGGETTGSPKDSMLNATQYGIPTDGVAPVTSSLVAAIVSASNSTKCLFLPNGTYVIDNAVIPPLTHAPCIIGESLEHTILKRKPHAAHNPVLTISETSGTSISNLQIDGNKSDEVNAGYNLVAMSVSGLTLHNVWSHGATFRAGAGSGLKLSTTTTATTISIQDLKSSDNEGDGIDIGPTARNVELRRVDASNNRLIGIKLMNYAFPPVPSSISSLLMTDIKVEDNGDAGLAALGFYTGGTPGHPTIGPGAEAVDGLVVSNVSALRNGTYGVVIQAAHAAVSDVVSSYNGKVGKGHAGLLANAEWSTFSRIKVEHNNSWGIDSGGCYHCSFSDVESGFNVGDGFGLGSARETELTDVHSYYNGVLQIGVNNYDSGGGSGIPYPAAVQINRCLVEGKPGELGIAVHENAKAEITNCSSRGLPEEDAFVYASNNVVSHANHTDESPVVYAIKRPDSENVEIPDWVEHLSLSDLPQSELRDIQYRFETKMRGRLFAVSVSNQQASTATVPFLGSGEGYTKAWLNVGPGCSTKPAGLVNINGGIVVGVNMVVVGSGCTSAPAVTVDGDGKGAKAVALVPSGVVRNGRRLDIKFLSDARILSGQGIHTRDGHPMYVKAGTTLVLFGYDGTWNVVPAVH